MQQDNPKHTSRSTKEWLKKNKVNVWICFGMFCQSPDLNPIKMKKIQLKLLHVIVQDWSAFTINFTFSYCSKGCHTRYWEQRFTYFCNAQTCNTGSLFSKNKWQRKIVFFHLFDLVLFVYFQDLYENLMKFLGHIYIWVHKLSSSTVYIENWSSMLCECF